MDRIEWLWTIQQIRTLKARFVRAADTQDAELLAGLLAEDVVVDFTQAARDPKSGFSIPSAATEAPIIGRDVAVAQICGALGEMVSIHHLGEPEIEIADDRHAIGIWPVADRLFLAKGTPLAELVGYGHYHEEYRKDDGTWRITKLRLTRLRFFGVPGGA